MYYKPNMAMNDDRKLQSDTTIWSFTLRHHLVNFVIDAHNDRKWHYSDQLQNH